ncbi:hypothetical protein CLOLEP_02692 [[Clostridium] leptum DSM 753]|uniref:Uncharacterized protein n=1 Tax=[Clostridium] leptum DSM 753 TaxID=428125 RepID=A7VVS9_9FIRM|nr:hypothetical protein CLOLEP_02692 [[Clostridium] leptum DSM 753]
MPLGIFSCKRHDLYGVCCEGKTNKSIGLKPDDPDGL